MLHVALREMGTLLCSQEKVQNSLLLLVQNCLQSLHAQVVLGITVLEEVTQNKTSDFPCMKLIHIARAFLHEILNLENILPLRFSIHAIEFLSSVEVE